MKRYLIALAVTGLVAGCAFVPPQNPFDKYYVDKSGGPERARATGIRVFSEPPQVTPGTNMDSDNQAMVGNGYALLGYSSFSGGEFPRDLVLDQARKVGATRVLVYYKYEETERGVKAVSTPTFGYAATRAPGVGTITSTAVGSSTSYVPTSMRRYSQFATFWAPRPNYVFGAYGRDLTAEERARLQSNKGVRLTAIVNRSPAFEADILKDDIIRAVAGQEVPDAQTLPKIIEAHAGQRVEIMLIRGDQLMSKLVQLNPKIQPLQAAQPEQAAKSPQAVQATQAAPVQLGSVPPTSQ